MLVFWFPRLQGAGVKRANGGPLLTTGSSIAANSQLVSRGI